MSKGESKEYRTRLKEITSVLHKYGITRGITPQKLRMILEDLGPTYIKIGQIMSLHSDILPKRYCDELMRLRTEVTAFRSNSDGISGSKRSDRTGIWLSVE